MPSQWFNLGQLYVTTTQYYTKLQKNPLIYDFSLRTDLKALCTEEYFSIFLIKILRTRYPRVPQSTTLRGKKPQIIYFWLKFFGLELKYWRQDCSFITRNGWDMVLWSFGGTWGPQNFKPCKTQKCGPRSKNVLDSWITSQGVPLYQTWTKSIF